MAENVLQTRIQLKYDTISEWNRSSLVLKLGELAIAEVPAATTSSGLTPPAIGIKVGDGVHRFIELPWIQAAAGDVYDWAKSPTPPTASQIPGLDDYISEQAGDTNTTYQLIQGTGSNVDKYFLQKHDIGDTGWTTVSTVDFTNIYGNRVTAIENWLWADGSNLLPSLGNRIAQGIAAYITNNLNNSDTAVAGSFVTAVHQTGGVVDNVERRALTAADISDGTLGVARGGIGVNTLEPGEVLVGNGTQGVSTKAIETSMPSTSSDNLITAGGVKEYVDNQVNGIRNLFSGAMHFKGIATNEVTIGGNENPGIAGYTTREKGDVILVGYAEYIWVGDDIGERWQLLGDESSFIMHGQITDSDIYGTLSQSKITNLVSDLNSKVDKVQGKQLSDENFTYAEKQKLLGIEAGAQVNTIEAIYVNGVPQYPNGSGEINLVIEGGGGTVQGARVPGTTQGQYEDIEIDEFTQKLEMARIAKTGDVADLHQAVDGSGNAVTVLVLDCGSASTVIS